jgi:protein-tyrosine phosphatase
MKIQFWDVEDTIGKYEPISKSQALELRHFIIKMFEEYDHPKFLVNCMAGQSRSAGVAKAIECLFYFGIGDEAKYDYRTGFSSEIDTHIRYSPNLTVFDRIIDC